MNPSDRPAPGALIVKVAVLATVVVVSLIFLMLSFLGRYLEQRAVLAALTPALVSSDFSVVSSALEMLKESVSPSRFQKFEIIARNRVKELIYSKWENTSLTPQALDRLQTTLDNASIFSKTWIRDLQAFEKQRQEIVQGKLSRLITLESALPSHASIVRLLKEGQSALQDEDCRTALSSFERARKTTKSGAANVGVHLSHVCFLGATPSSHPDGT